MSDHSTASNSTEAWSQYAKHYDPIKIGSIDGTDTEPHDKGIIRALNSEYHPNRHVKGKPECTIFVARLSPKTTKDTIKEVFSKYGRLRRFRLVKDIVTGTPKGYAFIEYEDERSAEDAYKKANKLFVDGQSIFVDFECERLLKDWKPRRLGGGFGGRKESGQLRFGGRDRPFRKPISLEIQEKQQMVRDREYRKDGHRSYKYRNSPERDERHRNFKERDNRERYRHNHREERNDGECYRHGQEHSNYGDTRHNEQSQNHNEVKEERHSTERKNNDSYKKDDNYYSNSKNGRN